MAEEKERVTQVHTPPAIRMIVRQRVAVVTASVFVGGLLLGITGSAGAVPMPSVVQVRHRVSQLEAKAQRLDEQYDQVQAQLTATNQRLKILNAEVAINTRRFNAMRGEIDRIAVTAYEDGNVSSSIELLVAGRPQQILNQSSLLLELADINNAQISQFVAEARQLTTTQEMVRRTKLSIQLLSDNLRKRKDALNKQYDQEAALLRELTPAQQTGLGPGGGSTTHQRYTGPTTTEADKAVAYAYLQLGCPYVYGGIGPCADGFDCSGLTMEAWLHAGVTIPRTSYEQWDDLPHVSLNDLQPGDILVFLDAGHVGIYVGHNKLIDAPQTGQDVSLVAFTGWYRANVDGAVVP
jgi:peptidoglycan DL-endopeptidase CwlO